MINHYSGNRTKDCQHMKVRSLAFALAVVFGAAACSDQPAQDQQEVKPTWTTELPSDLGQPYEAVSQGEHVLLSTANGTAVLSAHDGALLWSLAADEVPIQHLASWYLYDSSVVAVGADGYMGWDIASGDELFKFDDHVLNWSAFDAGLITVECPTQVCTIASLDPTSGDRLWRRDVDDGRFYLVPEGSLQAYHEDPVGLPSTGTQVALWSERNDIETQGEILDVESGDISIVLANQDVESEQAFFSSQDRFTEWNEMPDGSIKLTTYDTLTGEIAWTTTVTSVTGRWGDTSLIGTDIDGVKTLISAETGDVVVDATEETYLSVDDDLKYLTIFKDSKVDLQAQSTDTSDTIWSATIEEGHDVDPITFRWSAVSDANLVYHYGVAASSEAPAALKTLVADHDTGGKVWLAGELITPLSLQGNALLTSCPDTSCTVTNQRSIAYFDLG